LSKPPEDKPKPLGEILKENLVPIDQDAEIEMKRSK